MGKKGWLLFALFGFVLLACGIGDELDQEFDEIVAELEPADTEPQPPSDNDSRPEDSTACPFSEPSGYDISCGYLTVSENRTIDDSPTIEIAYAIVGAREPAGLPPIVYLAGGPGGSAIDDFVADPKGWDYPFTRSRDLILVDQRGTGYSWPTLDCPELAEDVSFDAPNPERVCHERLLADGIDLTAYNTAENAADIEALRQELGIESWDLLGISYGTRLALNIMRDYPDGVGSAVLDSVFPPNADTPGGEALHPYRSLQRLFADCASDAYCRDEYPDLEAVFIDTVSSLNESPVDDLFGDDLLFAITNALNDTQQIPWLPLTIYEVSEGNLGILDELAMIENLSRFPIYQDDVDRSDSEGMYNSVICHEEYIFGDYESAEARAVDVLPDPLEAGLLQPVADLFQLCSYWGAGAADPIENEAVYSDIPTLILVGLYDHATPPEWATLAAQTLDNAYIYEFPDAGHALLSGHTCAIAITDAFLDDPERAPASDCISEIEWPNFE